MTTYRQAAADGFAVLAQQYTPIFDGNFWFAGNTLHAGLNYLLAANETDKQKILSAGWAIYAKLVHASDWWHDDYAWWGNAFLLAITNRNKLGYQDPSHNNLFMSLGQAVEYCFKKLVDNWCAEGYGSCNGDSDNAAGSDANIIGGSFNTHNSWPMSGRNSVTNEGFWILAEQLAKWSPGKDHSDWAANERKWFQQWLSYPAGKIGILNANGLVLERPLGNGVDPAWYWAGDQGLMMEGLVVSGSSASQLADNVISHMTDKYRVLHENMTFNAKQPLQQFDADYATGKGICMRGIATVNRTLPARPYTSFIKKNAMAVWCNRLESGQFTFNWDWSWYPMIPPYERKILEVSGKSPALCNIIMQTAGLEALSAALWFAADEEIVCDQGA